MTDRADKTDLATRRAADGLQAPTLVQALLGDGHPAWAGIAALIGALVLLPIATVLWLAATLPGAGWRHMMAVALPPALRETAMLLAGVAITTSVVGVLTAWLVTMYRFPGRHVVDRLLILPLAVPVYIVAYCYVDLLDYSGPVQSLVRAMLGSRTARDYWFPEIRSVGGGVLVFSAVLYPYVYVIARASFAQQSAGALEVARTLGRSPWGTFLAVALPLARPAAAAGVALALMECLNDLGAAQHLGLRTLSAGIFTAWLQRSDLAAAAQLAFALLVVTTGLVAMERWSRGLGRRYATGDRHRGVPFATLNGPAGWLALAACALPVAAGFGIPVLMLLRNAVATGAAGLDTTLLTAARNSALLAGLATLATVGAALSLSLSRRAAPSAVSRGVAEIAGLGYALPGTVLAIGLIFPLAGLDRWLDAALGHMLGTGPGLLLSGSLAAVVLACSIRFLAVALGALDDGLGRISPNLDAVARTLGATPRSAMWRVHLPLLTPAITSAALLVFVDAMKELPATLLLRPFNFDTLATLVYNSAALEQFEASSAACLAIVAVGLVPVLVLHTMVAAAQPPSR